MSRYEAEKTCFALREEINGAAFRQNPNLFLSGFTLTEEERRAIKEGDIGFLYRLGVLYGALDPIARLFKYDNEEYVRRLREAAGLPDSPEQIAVLRRRAALRRKVE